VAKPSPGRTSGRPPRLGVVMDPIAAINPKKDSTLAMLLEAQARGWPIRYMEMRDLHVRDGRPYARQRALEVSADVSNWYHFGEESFAPLGELDVILMRKDPPFDIEYIYATYILERAEDEGALVVNRPRGLRDVSEKMFTAWLSQCTPPTLVTRDAGALRGFLADHGDVVFKPLHGMGGAGVFRLTAGDPNVSVVIETLTDHGQRFIIGQRFIPEISAGDKRILVIDGEPVPWALARVPAKGETRGNLAAGATGEGVALSERDRWICAQAAPLLRSRGILFAGLDVIGDYLTEVNVTSPTCIRELDAIYGLNIAATLLDAIEAKMG